MIKLENSNKETLVNNKYLNSCLRKFDVPMPAFVVMKQNGMFLCQFRMSDCMANTVKEYLEAVKD